MEDYLNILRKIFAGIISEASEEDITRLADNMALLEKRGLGKLNKRLRNSKRTREVLATIAEHNFAEILASHHSPTIPISYEPDIGLKRPPDFKLEIGEVTYWIQMKDLSKLERENRQDNMIKQIKREVSEIKVGKFFGCLLSDNFKESCLPELINFIKDKAVSAVEGDSLIFTGKNNQKAEIEFWSAGKITLSELTLGVAGDLEIIEMPGLAREQIKQSLLNAVGAFDWEADRRNINLIVIEADSKEDIDIYDALFGTEYEIIGKDNHSWSRKDDGLFGKPDFSKHVAGVIAIKKRRERVNENEIFPLSADAAKFAEYCNMTQEQIIETLKWKNPGPIADYSMILYMNSKFQHLLEDIKRLLSFDEVVYHNMRPPMGNRNFGLSQ